MKVERTTDLHAPTLQLADSREAERDHESREQAPVRHTILGDRCIRELVRKRQEVEIQDVWSS